MDGQTNMEAEIFWTNLSSISFQTAQLKLKGSSATLTIVSRRCTMRLGTRMWRRGANLDGDVANFIEAEQLVETEGFQSSLLQHGDEGQLSTAFSAEMQNLPNVSRYVSFDFHHVCGNSNFENLKVLYEQISEQFEKQGYFLVDVKGNILEEQNGIVRSNCIDWLDRTNVTQSYLAQKSLDARLQRTGVLDSFESISIFVEDYQTFRALWVEQGDEISLEYPGTYALKGDLVRYGKQTFGGIIKDGMSALSRYFLNNFRMA
ncbi:phosphoinositide phosphatase SAC8-like isoform X4 [Malus sylvestris]|uniref:phosphoinositide phosphatase SAC8-like isoform X4 n=1 Tax=Malus sylvestris TaxID=3752 RepID=UPI0021AC39AD|nr:phosphoinositide phosphatase SAC8-like isoform X4 [Malus sylvestris]